MKIKQYAPVLICTLNRHVHFKRCVESLAACTHADKTDLYIGLDYPSKDDHWEGYRIIKAYLDTIKGFKTVNITVREKNFGVYDNWMGMEKYVYEQHDRIIISEDDNIFSTDFLNFVNKGLEKYKDRNDIFSISGYVYPIDMPKIFAQDTFLWSGFSGWGVGMWKNKYETVEWDEKKALHIINVFLKSPYNIYKLNRVANHYISALITMVKRKCILGDGYYSMLMVKNNQYSLFPNQSRVRNMGHDGDGENCVKKENSVFSRQPLFGGSGEYTLPARLPQKNNSINAQLSKYFKQPYKRKIKTYINWLIFRVKNF